MYLNINVNYHPFGMGLIGRTYKPDEYRYSFNGFEKDDEVTGDGNHLSFGDYGYDTRLIVRWSPDKYAAKYTWQSPYSVVGNNPILNREIDGKDYGLYIDHNTKTITVKATYYTPKGDKDSYHSAAQATQFWNEQSGKYQYIVGQKNAQITYNISFELTVREVDNPRAESTKDRASFISSDAKLTPDKSSNTYEVLSDASKIFENSEEGKNTNGAAIDGSVIAIKDSRKETETGAHEIGHTLGLKHFSKGILTSASNDPKRSESITSRYVKGVISNAFKNKSKAQGTIHETGTTPEKFNKGNVVEKE